MVGALAGTSSTTSYIESAAGAASVASGRRPGLTALLVAALFLLWLILAPLAQSVPAYATSAALLFVAGLMALGLAELTWDDGTEAEPAVITAAAIPLGFSIADGIGIGIIAYAAVKLLAGGLDHRRRFRRQVRAAMTGATGPLNLVSLFVAA